MTATATLELEDLTVVYEAKMVKCDYGVQGSPVWYEPEDISIISLEVVGVEVDVDKMPEKLINRLLSMADEVTEEFEQDY